jgi:hemoglobin
VSPSTFRVRFLSALLLLLTLTSLAVLAQDKPQKSLYHRMGGYDVIAGVVDDFLKQLGGDPAFKRFGGGRSEGSLKRARQLIVDQICALTGGPCVYFGRDMKASHKGLKITIAEWDSSIAKLRSSLAKFNVGAAEQDELVAMIQKLRDEIVEVTQEGSQQAQN